MMRETGMTASLAVALAAWCSASSLNSKSVKAAAVVHSPMEIAAMAMAQNKKPAPEARKTEVRGPMKPDVFGMKNEDYFDAPLKKLSPIRGRLEDEGFEGILLGGPGYVPLGKVDRFPVVALQATDARDAALHPFSDYALLTAMDIRQNLFYVQTAVEQKYVKRDPGPNRELPPEGRSTDGCGADLFARLELPKTEGEYLVTAIHLHTASNRLLISAGHPDLEKDAKKFEEAMAAQLAGRERKPKGEGINTFLSVQQEPQSPPIPEALGIEWVVEPKVINKTTKKPAMVFASYNLPVAPNPTEAERKLEKDGVGSSSVFVLTTGSGNPKPFLKRLDLTSAKLQVEGGKKTVSGYFSIELNRVGRIEKGRNFIYAFSGPVLSGPVEVGLDGE